jgi:hypothetical protein
MPIIARDACGVHVPPDSATTSWRASSHACSESIRTPSRSKTTASMLMRPRRPRAPARRRPRPARAPRARATAPARHAQVVLGRPELLERRLDPERSRVSRASTACATRSRARSRSCSARTSARCSSARRCALRALGLPSLLLGGRVGAVALRRGGGRRGASGRDLRGGRWATAPAAGARARRRGGPGVAWPMPVTCSGGSPRPAATTSRASGSTAAACSVSVTDWTFGSPRNRPLPVTSPRGGVGQRPERGALAVDGRAQVGARRPAGHHPRLDVEDGVAGLPQRAGGLGLRADHLVDRPGGDRGFVSPSPAPRRRAGRRPEAP